MLAVTGYMATAPSSASAAAHDGVCDPSEFCMGRMGNLSGGMYDNPSSDPDLRNDRFVRYWAQIVSDNTWSVLNKGITHEVLVYDGVGYTGAVACVRRTRGMVNFVAGQWWQDRISSYRFVASCGAIAAF
jgi:hypothetical protein